MNTGLLRGITARFAWLLISETIIIVAAVYAGAFIRMGGREWERLVVDFPKALLIAAVTQLCLYFADLYDFRVLSKRRELFVGAVQALGATSVILALLYYWFPDLVVGRGVFVVAAGLVVTTVFGWRVAFEWTSSHVAPRERLLLVGTSDAAVRLARELYEQRSLGVEIVGFIDSDPARIGAPVINPGVIGTIEDIPAIVRARGVDRVVVSLTETRGRLPMEKLLEMRMQGVQFAHLASVYERYTGKIAIDNLRPSWLIFSDGFRAGRVQHAAKRVLDVSVAGIGLLLLLPLLPLIAIAVKLSSPGPVFYHQQRVGQHGRVFIIHKFRTMVADAEKETGAVWATANDRRATRIGRFLRRTRLDEVPQLWNVLRGDMSVVGPRPERPEFVALLRRDIPYYGQRHTVRPGVTGWAQVQYAYGANAQDAVQKLQFDIYYIKHASLALDLFIIAKTIKTVLMRKGAQ